MYFNNDKLEFTTSDVYGNVMLMTVQKEILIKQFKLSLGTCITKLDVLRLLNHPVVESIDKLQRKCSILAMYSKRL